MPDTDVSGGLATADRAAVVPAASTRVLGVFGTSPAMRQVLEQIREAARARRGVVVCGERGTGREMVARAIHAQGGADGRPFVRVSCGVIGPQALEHELFGLTSVQPEGSGERRSAERIARESLLYRAHGGTLFLEQIADMPSRVQSRMVRVLRDGEAVVTADGRRTRKQSVGLDILPVTSLEPGFEASISDGRLRADLYERLAGIRVDLPPLRQRREDIPALALHFLTEICRQRGAAPRTLTRSAVTLMAALPWRGNATELRDVLERLVALSPQHLIRLEDVLAQIRLDGDVTAGGAAITLREARQRFERDYIGAVLQQHHGRVGDAARVLGIQRTNLYRKVRQLRVVRPQRRGFGR
jgi:DNA-binding NtrC family response regulator